jgi:hypothetical protein
MNRLVLTTLGLTLAVALVGCAGQTEPLSMQSPIGASAQPQAITLC